MRYVFNPHGNGGGGGGGMSRRRKRPRILRPPRKNWRSSRSRWLHQGENHSSSSGSGSS